MKGRTNTNRHLQLWTNYLHSCNNDMLYGNAVQLLKNPNNLNVQKLSEWSFVASLSSLSDANCLHRFSKYSVLQSFETITAEDERQAFELLVDLPSTSMDPASGQVFKVILSSPNWFEGLFYVHHETMPT